MQGQIQHEGIDVLIPDSTTTLRVDPVEIQEVMPLAEARAALEKVRTGHTRGKIVLKVT